MKFEFCRWMRHPPTTTYYYHSPFPTNQLLFLSRIGPYLYTLFQINPNPDRLHQPYLSNDHFHLSKFPRIGLHPCVDVHDRKNTWLLRWPQRPFWPIIQPISPLLIRLTYINVYVIFFLIVRLLPLGLTEGLAWGPGLGLRIRYNIRLRIRLKDRIGVRLTYKPGSGEIYVYIIVYVYIYKLTYT